MKTKFVCQNCGASAPKWLGRCPSCSAYNTMVEEAIEQSRSKRRTHKAKPVALANIPIEEKKRWQTGISELDRVLGGGFVRGSLTLLGGDPGIGKSTLMLQICDAITDKKRKVLYVNGEESAHQIRLRAGRLDISGGGIDTLAVTEMETILAVLRKDRPDFVVIDSIQTIYKSQLSSAPGSVAQVRECGSDLMRIAKEEEITIALIGHVTKYGMIAGPKTLEHIVDTVLYFEGDRNQQYRIVRAIKNRFGSTNEIGVFEMTEQGLCEVANPSHLFISDSTDPGSAIVSIIEGSRPLLVEVQALTSPTFYNYPQRITTGIDHKRLSMLLAVLERRASIKVSGIDCYVNIVGGIKVDEPSCDLGILLAVASSVKNIPIQRKTVSIGEAGLGGEVRPVSNINERLNEAENLGFTTAIVPHKNTIGKNDSKIKIIYVDKVRDAVNQALK